MALDLGIGDRTSLQPLQSEPSLCLNDDGYYWFLHPLFEQLRAETGQYIDLYGGASFDDGGLIALEKMLAQAARLVSGQPATWLVHTGKETKPLHQELYAEVEKACFLDLVSAWKH